MFSLLSLNSTAHDKYIYHGLCTSGLAWKKRRPLRLKIKTTLYCAYSLYMCVYYMFKVCLCLLCVFVCARLLSVCLSVGVFNYMFYHRKCVSLVLHILIHTHSTQPCSFYKKCHRGLQLQLHQPKPPRKTWWNSQGNSEKKCKEPREEQFSGGSPPPKTVVTQRGTDHRLNIVIHQVGKWMLKQIFRIPLQCSELEHVSLGRGITKGHGWKVQDQHSTTAR